jgi:hypothetical protein
MSTNHEWDNYIVQLNTWKRRQVVPKSKIHETILQEEGHDGPEITVKKIFITIVTPRHMTFLLK